MKIYMEEKKNIPTENHFWGKLFATGNLNILANRVNENTNLAQTVENLNTELIKYVHPNNNASGAIQDLGKFHEGYCISIATKRPANMKNKLYIPRKGFGKAETWVICTDDEESKKQLMSWLVSMKLKRQKTINDILVEKKSQNIPKIPKTAGELLRPKPYKPKIKRGGPSHKDGYMILLQDWSPCSVKCGGGTSTQQWICVPPQEGGRPCPGDSLLTRKCNKHPCPGVHKGLKLPKNDKTHVTLLPIYAALPFSKRPENYVECEIKESDVLYATKDFDPKHKIEVKMPARLVMNTQTISLFKDESYATALVVFNLTETAITLSKKDPCCFYLTNANRDIQICGFSKTCGTKEKPIWVSKWSRDFDYFVTKCHKDLEETDLKAKLNGKIPPIHPQAPGANGGGIRVDIPNMTNLQSQVVRGKRSVIKKAQSTNIQLKMDKQVDQVHKVSLTALRREINLEDLVTKEEKAKATAETEQLKEQFRQEKKKKKILHQALRMRERSYQQVQLAKNTQFKINEVKHETKVEIKFKRAVLKKKLETIRRKVNVRTD